jgi:hypothetical protein
MLAAGAPCEGKGRNRRVDAEALRRWRSDDSLGAVARALYGVWKRDGGEGVPIWLSLGLPEAQTLALLVETYERVAHELRRSSEPLPAELRHVMSRLVQLAQSQQRVRTDGT